jgi:hypothetical protein
MAMKVTRELKGILFALLIAGGLLIALFVLRSATQPEKQQSSEEVADTATDGGSQGDSQEGDEQKLLLKKGKVDPKANLLDALGGGSGSKQMKDHLKKIRESSR